MAGISDRRQGGCFFTAVVVGSIAYIIALLYAYTWVSQRPFPTDGLIGGVCGGMGLPLIAYFAGKKTKVKHNTMPEPTQTRLRDALDAEGLRVVNLSYAESGKGADFPRPLAIGVQLMLSKRVLADFTRDALIWSVKTDALAAVRSIYLGFPIFYALIGLSVLSIGLCERLKLSAIWLSLPFGIAILAFVVFGCVGYGQQVDADRRFTKTDQDRRAAKEALSYPFFAQTDRKSEKWMFSRLELRARAKRLGLELERGFHATESSPDCEIPNK